MNAASTCNLASKDSYSAILSDCRAAMEKLRAPEDAIREYLDRVAGVIVPLSGAERHHPLNRTYKEICRVSNKLIASV